MKLRERAIWIFKIYRKYDDASLRELAEQTSIPKSSIHRQKIKQQERIDSIGHSFFETADGLEWLQRLFFSVIFIFGIQAGVGAETISLFFSATLLTGYVGSSPSCLRDIKQKMRNVIDEYGEEQMPEIYRRCENKELHLGGDETSFDGSLFLILMELSSGFIFTEELVEDRKYETWLKCVGSVLEKCKKVVSFTSDGGRALLKLCKTFGCDPVMDLFHLLKDVKSLFATKFHSKRRSLLSKKEKLEKEPLASEEEQTEAIANIHTKFALLDKGQKDYRDALFAISTQSQPFKNVSETKTSSELAGELKQQLSQLRATTQECEIEDKVGLLNRFERRIKSSSRLNDLWHNWVEQSVLNKTQDDAVKMWATHALLPVVYWEEQARKSKRKESLKSYYLNLTEQAVIQLEKHPLTAEYLTKDWISWATAMALKYQRTTSPLEGRNGRITYHYFSARGIRPSHINSLTVINNCWIKRADGTTAAERLCNFKPPDLFEYILAKMKDLPIPRKRGAKIPASAVSQLAYATV